MCGYDLRFHVTRDRIKKKERKAARAGSQTALQTDKSDRREAGGEGLMTENS